MEKNIIRKLVLEEIENPINESDKKLFFVEYLETDQKAVGTGNKFSMNEVIAALVRLRTDIFSVQSSIMGNIEFESRTDIYNFSFKNGFNVDKNGTLNKRVKDVEIIIPKEVKDNNLTNETLETLESQLDRIANNFQKKLEIKSYKIIRKTNYIKAVGVIAAVTIGGTALAHYASEQQILQNQKAIAMVQRHRMDFSEMRQMYGLGEWMKEQNEDYKRTK